MLVNSIYIKSAILAAITLIITLAWNDLIQSTIGLYITPGETLIAKLTYASVITLAGTIVLTYIDPNGNHIAKNQSNA
ncbi:hypothetical protein D5b_00032 [Faustovirus]|nr:hypothetical protein D5b_00032 [Faustovirus]AMN84877.1 hypothetical protein D6_00478 [Faustovirus]AMP43991.1 hypothetical protein PRJ_Dakar_00031 [Faustovirus]QKE50560.1 hypothetical protein F-VV10_0440 [Faustovirus]